MRTVSGDRKAKNSPAKATKRKQTAKPAKRAVSSAAQRAAQAAIPVMADTGTKLPSGLKLHIPADNLPTRKTKRGSSSSHMTKGRQPLQVSLPPILIDQMKTIKLLKGVSYVDQIIYALERAGYKVDSETKQSLNEKYD